MSLGTAKTETRRNHTAPHPKQNACPRARAHTHTHTHTHIHTEVTCCFAPSQPVRLYQGEQRERERERERENKRKKMPIIMEQDIFNLGTRIAQLVQCPTEMSLAILKVVRVPGAAREFSSRVNLQCRLSYGVPAAHVCNRSHRHL